MDRREQYIPVISTIETDDGLEYLAEFKEFLFCGGCGKTKEEAIEDAYKNLEIYLEELAAPESCIVPASEMVEAIHKIEKRRIILDGSGHGLENRWRG